MAVAGPGYNCKEAEKDSSSDIYIHVELVKCDTNDKNIAM
jgi:hypothetical protein